SPARFHRDDVDEEDRRRRDRRSATWIEGASHLEKRDDSIVSRVGLRDGVRAGGATAGSGPRAAGGLDEVQKAMGCGGGVLLRLRARGRAGRCERRSAAARRVARAAERGAEPELFRSKRRDRG